MPEPTLIDYVVARALYFGATAISVSAYGLFAALPGVLLLRWLVIRPMVNGLRDRRK